jgi:transposase
MAYPILTIRKHLKTKAIYKRYLGLAHATERSYWHVIWLLARENNPLTAEKTAEVIGCTPDWVRKLANRYNKEGPGGLVDKRKHNGNKKILGKGKQNKLKKLLVQRPADGGLWTGPKVARWIGNELGEPVSAVTGWHYLRFFGFSLKVPRPQHKEAASPQMKAAFKKNFKKR